MLKNYIKVAWRNIWRKKLYSSINVFGLSIAFAISTLLFMVAYFQLSFDNFHKDSEKIFKVSILIKDAENPPSDQVPLGFLSTIKDNIPDIAYASRLIYGTPEAIGIKDKKISRIITRVDPDFLKIFNFEVLNGDVNSALKGTHSIALTESTAKALFGDENAIGKAIKVGREGEEKSFVVSAILADCPKNSSIQFQALASVETMEDYVRKLENRGDNASNLFIKIAEKSNPILVGKKFDKIANAFFATEISQLKAKHTEPISRADLMELILINISQIHFKGARSTPLFLVYGIIGLAIFILLVACFNFVSLNLARSFQRSREIGVRKSLGAIKRQIFSQLWGEAILLYGIGFLLGIFFSYLLIPFFEAKTNAGLDISFLFQPSFLLLLLGIFFFITFLAGGLPALHMAKINSVEVMRGKLSGQKPGMARNALLVSQFAISGLLICISVIANRQLEFLREKPIGFNKDEVVSIPVGNQHNGQLVLERMKNELQRNPYVLSISGSDINLGRGKDRITKRSTVNWEYNENQVEADWILADANILRTLGISLISGRNFNENSLNDKETGLIVTKSFVEAMNEKQGVGKFIGENEKGIPYNIIGVIPDFNYFSPSEKQLPLAFHFSTNKAIQYIFLKTNATTPDKGMALIENAWSKATNNAEFQGSFLNDNLQAWYEGESFMTGIFSVASLIAIFLSCLGLFALSLLVIQARTKEIGIRKVMGASVPKLVSMLSLYFLKRVFMGMVIALPLAWFVMQKWLDNYSYRIEMSWVTFFLVFLLVSVLAILTVGFNTIKAALMNPVNSLRSE